MCTLMKKVLFALLLFGHLYAQESECLCSEDVSAKNAVGVILSYGEGRGLMYRHYFDNSYLQQSGYIYYSRNSDYSNFAMNYGLSVGKYLFSSKSGYFKFKTLVGTEGTYDYSYNRYYNHESSTDIASFGIVSGGFGFEFGERKRGSLMYGIDALYMFRYDAENDYGIYPSMAIYMGYNF